MSMVVEVEGTQNQSAVCFHRRETPRPMGVALMMYVDDAIPQPITMALTVTPLPTFLPQRLQLYCCNKQNNTILEKKNRKM